MDAGQKIECGICGKAFNSDEALAMHTKAKHNRPEKRQLFAPHAQKKIRNIAFILIAIIAIGFVIFYAISGIKILPPIDISGHVEESPASHVLREPMPIAVQKHMLEHADGEGRPGVVINYNCENFACEPALIAKLEAFAQRYDYVYVAPFTNMSVKIALTKLGNIETMGEYDEKLIEAFILGQVS
ncbi:MAG: hypothetical protein HYW05_00840 [Candidatus Diapherotrites archaeon]|nr:hypothetical protein [Candidatus Diapherotrites archaeon]